jgi:hypothetical protein
VLSISFPWSGRKTEWGFEISSRLIRVSISEYFSICSSQTLFRRRRLSSRASEHEIMPSFCVVELEEGAEICTFPSYHVRLSNPHHLWNRCHRAVKFTRSCSSHCPFACSSKVPPSALAAYASLPSQVRSAMHFLTAIHAKWTSQLCYRQSSRRRSRHRYCWSSPAGLSAATLDEAPLAWEGRSARDGFSSVIAPYLGLALQLVDTSTWVALQLENDVRSFALLTRTTFAIPTSIHRRRDAEASILFLSPRYVLADECRRRWLELRVFRRAGRAAGRATYGSDMRVLYGSK